MCPFLVEAGLLGVKCMWKIPRSWEPVLQLAEAGGQQTLPGQTPSHTPWLKSLEPEYMRGHWSSAKGSDADRQGRLG